MDLLIYGAGSHGQVIADAAEAAGLTVVGFIDDVPETSRAIDRPVFGTDAIVSNDAALIVAVGDNTARRRIACDLLASGRRIISVIHPTAVISPSATIADGAYVGPQAVINARARVGAGVIINTAAVVEHDCVIDDYAHIAPQAALGGGVHVGMMSMVGIGASVCPRVAIGERTLVGAGAAVIGDVPSGLTVVGVPARRFLPPANKIL